MLFSSAAVRGCVSYRWLPVALATLFSSSVIFAHSTTVEQDFRIVHNVDNRSPEIDPFWYVGRGVRPIGRFGKRHSSYMALDNRGMQPVVSSLELLLNIWNKENPGKSREEVGREWLA